VADFSQTISNVVNCFGGSPSTKWGNNAPYTMTWGTSKWGEGTEDLQVAVVKLISNSQSLSDDYSRRVEKLVSNDLTPTSETTSETLQDGSGWRYVFTSDTTEAENRDEASYSSGTAASTSWTSATAASTSWS